MKGSTLYSAAAAGPLVRQPLRLPPRPQPSPSPRPALAPTLISPHLTQARERLASHLQMPHAPFCVGGSALNETCAPGHRARL